MKSVQDAYQELYLPTSLTVSGIIFPLNLWLLLYSVFVFVDDDCFVLKTSFSLSWNLCASFCMSWKGSLPSSSLHSPTSDFRWPLISRQGSLRNPACSVSLPRYRAEERRARKAGEASKPGKTNLTCSRRPPLSGVLDFIVHHSALSVTNISSQLTLHKTSTELKTRQGSVIISYCIWSSHNETVLSESA